ncbi:hypothetical protein ACOSQ4_025799 [Xanthoceras sorbifolium]
MEIVRSWNTRMWAYTFIKTTSSLQVSVGAIEEETIRCDEVPVEGEVLGVSSASFYCLGHTPHLALQGSHLGLQGQAGLCCLSCWVRHGGRKRPECGRSQFLNSYWINEDSTYKYFEVIMVDIAHNAVRNDSRINWLCNPVHKHKELRGLTSAGKKYRGLLGR